MKVNTSFLFVLLASVASLQHRPVLAGEEVVHLRPGVRVGSAHESTAEDADVEGFCHAIGLLDVLSFDPVFGTRRSEMTNV